MMIIADRLVSAVAAAANAVIVVSPSHDYDLMSNEDDFYFLWSAEWIFPSSHQNHTPALPSLPQQVKTAVNTFLRISRSILLQLFRWY